jgi:tetratricopeptide (TPR) repeat protein
VFATPGELIADRFEIDRHVGSGGMGVVYRALDRKTAGVAAVKLVRAGDAQVTARFEREARALAELAHPNIVQYIAHGETPDGSLYLAMEWLDGEDLATRLQVARLSIADTIALIEQAAAALGAAHARGIVHRDVKPSNLFLVEWRPERAKLLDFGVARLGDMTSLTRTGALIGTPQYMAPEQVTGREIDARTDVFALGAVMFHALTGRPPFPARSLPELVAQLIAPDEAPRAKALVRDVPAALDELTARMLAKDPARRVANATAVAIALGEIRAGASSAGVATADTGIVDPPAPRDPSIDELMQRGRAAFADGRWHDARAAYEAALARQDGSDVRFWLGGVLWWLADVRGSIEHQERAYAMFRKAGGPEATTKAAATALSIAMTHKKTLDNDAACNGWIARAQRLLGDEPGPLHGMLWCVQAQATNDPTNAVKLNEQALAHARAHGNRHVELIALAALGAARVASGDLERGLALIDESMAETFGAGEPAFEIVVPVTCCMVIACDQIADTRRMLQWCRVADTFMSRYGSPLLFAECRAHYGSALLATGHWRDAERELEAAKAVTSGDNAYYTIATARLAELRVRQGRLAEAEQMIEEIADRPPARAVSAALRHAAGEHALAAALLRRYIDSSGSRILDVVSALDLLVDTSAAAGDLRAAAAAATRLGELARVHPAKLVAAHAAFAAGRLAVLRGELDVARVELERATDLFRAADSPYEAARAGFALARLLADRDAPVAANEARSARSAFERLGADRDTAAADDLLRTLGTRS